MGCLSQHGTGVAHLARCTLDVRGLARFYCNVLGFDRLARPDFPFVGAWLRADDFVVHIIAAQPTGNRTFDSPAALAERHEQRPGGKAMPTRACWVLVLFIW